MAKANMVFDDDKVARDLVFIRDLWRRREYWLADPNPPEIMFHPEGVKIGTRLHAEYLLFVAYLSRSGKTANQVIRIGGRIATTHPEYLDPACGLFHSDPRAVDILSEAMVFEQYERAEGWIANMRHIREKYHGDIFQMFDGLRLNGGREGILEARAELIRRVDDLWGIGHKIAQLAIAWFQNVNWPSHKNDWRRVRQLPVIAIDVHALRLIKQFGWVESYQSDNWDKLAEPVSDYLSEQMLDLGFDYTDWHDAAQGMWHIQARLCNCYRRCKSQQAARQRCLTRCPAVTICGGLVPANDGDERHRRTMNWDNYSQHPPSALQTKLVEVPFQSRPKPAGVQSAKEKVEKEEHPKLDL